MSTNSEDKLALMRRMADVHAEISELRDWMASQSAEAALHHKYAPRDVWLSSQKRLRELGREHQSIQIKIAELNRAHREQEATTTVDKRKLFNEVVKEFLGPETYDSLWAEVERRMNPTKPALSVLPPESAPRPLRVRKGSA